MQSAQPMLIKFTHTQPAWLSRRTITFVSVATVAVAIVFSALVSGSAQAGTVFMLRGAGYGHGIGMSQYGAYGYAQNGSNYKQIIEHYYTGTTVGQASSRSIRVLLQASTKSVKVSGATKASGGHTLDPGKTYTLSHNGTGVRLSDPDGKTIDNYSDTVLITGDTPMQLGGAAINGVKNGKYRGSFELSVGALGGVTVVNV